MCDGAEGAVNEAAAHDRLYRLALSAAGYWVFDGAEWRTWSFLKFHFGVVGSDDGVRQLARSTQPHERIRTS